MQHLASERATEPRALRRPHDPVIGDLPEPPVQPLFALVADDCTFAVDLFVTPERRRPRSPRP